MKRIWKFPIQLTHSNFLFTRVEVPVGSRFLTIGKQYAFDGQIDATLVMWVEVGDELVKTEQWWFGVVLTGEKFDIDPSYRYVGTVTLKDDPPFVVHVYLRDGKAP